MYATGSLLPRVMTQSSTESVTYQQQQPSVAAAVTMTDSHSTFSGRTMRPVPSNGFSIDDRTMLVSSLSTDI